MGQKVLIFAHEVLLAIQQVDDQLARQKKSIDSGIRVANLMSNLEIQPHTKTAPIIISEEFKEFCTTIS